MEVLLSSYETNLIGNNLSVKYSNIYSINGELCYVADEPIELPYAKKFTNSYDWRPTVILRKDVLTAHEKEIDLAAIGDNIWYGNIGHAIFDGLYPMYVSLTKFGFEEEDFTILSSDWSNKNIISYEVVTTFSGRDLQEYCQLNKQEVVLYKTLVAGTEGCGNRIMSPTYTLFGEKEFQSLSKFKKRIMKRFGCEYDKSINKKLNAIFIRNKRYTEEEFNVIRQVIKHYENSELINLRFIDWYHDYRSFKEQMVDFQDVDIQITGPGTGMMYTPFLKKGAVNINLGYIEYVQTNTARPNIKIEESDREDIIIPGWMEQSVCAAADYVNTLYYDRFAYNNLEFDPLIKIIDSAISKVGTFQENNHNIDALVFIEYCKRCKNPQEICSYLTGIAFFIELFVNEHPKAIPSNLVDLDLLRQIKKELKYNTNYEIKI